MRALLVAVMLCVASTTWAAVVLDEVAELGAGDRELDTGEYVQSYDVDVAPGDLVTVTVVSADFSAYAVVKAPDERGYDGPVDDMEGPLRFIAHAFGEATVAVTTVDPGETGGYSLTVDVTPLARGLAGLEIALDETGTLSAQDDELQSGEYADLRAIDVTEGDVVRIVAYSSDFDAMLLVGSPTGLRFESDDVDGTDPEVTFVAEATGEVGFAVTSATPGETGAYRVWAETARLGEAAPAVVDQPPAPVVPVGAAGALVDERGALTADSETLGGGEFAEAHEVDVAAGQVVDLRLDADGFAGHLIVKQPDGEQVEQAGEPGKPTLMRVQSPAAGKLLLVITTTDAGQTGAYRLQVRDGGTIAPTAPAVADQPPAVVTPAGGGPTVTAETPDSPAKPVISVSPRDPSQRLPAPTPNPATVADPGILKDTLHRMPQVSVGLGGAFNRKHIVIHVGVDLPVHEFHDKSGVAGGRLEVYAGSVHDGEPSIVWFGNIFRFSYPTYEQKLSGEGEAYEKLLEDEASVDVTGVVAPDGSRIERVTIVEHEVTFVTYTKDWRPVGDPVVPGGERHYLRGETTAITLVDVPLVRSIPGNSDNGWERTWKRISMAELVAWERYDADSFFDLMYRLDGPDVRDHVLKVEHWEDSPAYPYATDIWTPQSHTTKQLRRVEWLRDEFPPWISVSFKNF